MSTIGDFKIKAGVNSLSRPPFLCPMQNQNWIDTHSREVSIYSKSVLTVDRNEGLSDQ